MGGGTLNDITGVYSIASQPVDNVKDGSSWTWNYTVGRADHTDRAFGVYAAIAVGHRYMKQLRGDSWSQRVEANYPTPYGGTAYQWLTNNLEIGENDWSDWDVIQHEYGHFVADVLGFDDTQCTIFDNCEHGGYENMSTDLYNGDKDTGTAMAWAEGWPTFFAVSLQREMHVSTTIPGANDTEYNDFNWHANPVVKYRDTLETEETGLSKGEDQEYANARILWDLYDSQNDTGDTDVSYDDGYLMERFRATDSNRFSQAYSNLINDNMSLPAQLKLGGLVSQHQVAPSPRSPSSAIWAAESTPLPFSWDPGGDGVNLPSNVFRVLFFNDSMTTVIWESNYIVATSWTPLPSEWSEIRSRSGPVLRWAVEGTQTRAPITGPYLSRAAMTPKNQITGMALSPKALTLANVGLGQKLTTTATLSNGSTCDISGQTAWTSDDKTVATVSNTGYVTAVATGTTTIRATYKQFTDTASVTVTCPASGSSFDCAIVISGAASGTVSAGSNAYYKMKVSAGTAYRVTVSLSSGDADLFVHNPAKLLVGFSENPDTYPERVTFVPTVTGYYYFRVYGYAGASSYSLNVTTTTCTPGVSLDCPLAVSVGGNTAGSVGARDVTYLRFNGNAGMTYTITSRPTSGNPELYMYDPYLNGIGDSQMGSSLHDQVVITAPVTGNYFIEMYGYDPSAFVVSVASGNTGCATGYDKDCAIPWGSSVSHYIDHRWSIYYKFYATANTNYQITLTPSYGDPDLYVYDSNNGFVGSSTAGTGATDRVSFSASTSGYYYVRVYGYSAAGFSLSR